MSFKRGSGGVFLQSVTMPICFQIADRLRQFLRPLLNSIFVRYASPLVFSNNRSFLSLAADMKKSLQMSILGSHILDSSVVSRKPLQHKLGFAYILSPSGFRGRQRSILLLYSYIPLLKYSMHIRQGKVGKKPLKTHPHATNISAFRTFRLSSGVSPQHQNLSIVHNLAASVCLYISVRSYSFSLCLDLNILS
jgi:hypothetical protein